MHLVNASTEYFYLILYLYHLYKYSILYPLLSMSTQYFKEAIEHNTGN